MLASEVQVEVKSVGEDTLDDSAKTLCDWLEEAGQGALDIATGGAPDVIAIVDRNLVIRYLNYTKQDFDKSNVVGGSVLAITPPDYHQISREAFSRVFETGIPTDYEVMFKDETQLHVWNVRLGPVRVAGEIVGVIALNHEVSEQRRQSVERDRFFLLSLDTLAVANAAGYFTRLNPAFGQLLGYEVSELLAQPFSSFVHPDDRGSTQRAFDSVLAGKPITDFENRYRCKDESYRVLSWRATLDPLTGDVHSVARDVTEQRTTELQLRHAQKMEAIGQLAGGVAHDFNNLMLAVLANAELALDEASLNATVIEHLQEIQGAGERAAALTKQLLAFSRQQPLRATSIELNELIRGLLKMLRRLLPENIVLDFVAAHKLARVNADTSQLEQVVVNLCVNARDAMPNGGRLSIETENVLVNGRYAESHPWAIPGRYVLLSVTDTGVGMTREARERAFEPFFTTKPMHKGTGLGLATVYGIVRQHDGMVNVYSEVGHGSTFKVYLPASERPIEDVGTKLEPPPARGNETVLLAEDERRVRRAVARILERAGYRVLVACDGAEAVALVRQTPETIHLAILDVVMPELSGPDTWEHLRKLQPGMLVLFSSGYADNRFSTQLPDGTQILEKPFRTDELLRSVREVLDAARSDWAVPST